MKLPSEVMKVQAGLMRLKNRGLFVVHRGLIFAGRCMPATIFSALFPMIRIHVSTLETKPALKSMIRTHDTSLKKEETAECMGGLMIRINDVNHDSTHDADPSTADTL